MTKFDMPVNVINQDGEPALYEEMREAPYPKVDRDAKLPRMKQSFYEEHKLAVGITLGVLITASVLSYFQNKNYGLLNSKLKENQELSQAMARNTETCKQLIEKNQAMITEYESNSQTILTEIEAKMGKKREKVVNESEEIKSNPN